VSIRNLFVSMLLSISVITSSFAMEAREFPQDQVYINPSSVNYPSEQEVSSLPIIAITRRDSWTILPEEIKAIIINHIGSKHSKDVSSIDKETWHIFDCYTHHIKLSQGAFYTLDFFHRFKNLISLNFGQNRQLSDESLKLLTNLHTLVLGLNERIWDKAFKLITNLLN